MFDFERFGGVVKRAIFGGEQEREVFVQDLHRQYIDGKIGPAELYQMLLPKQIEDFIAYHLSARANLLESPIPRIQFKVNQLDGIIERGLDKPVREAHGERVVERWN